MASKGQKIVFQDRNLWDIVDPNEDFDEHMEFENNGIIEMFLGFLM
jgi:hypothetical protein